MENTKANSNVRDSRLKQPSLFTLPSRKAGKAQTAAHNARAIEEAYEASVRAICTRLQSTIGNKKRVAKLDRMKAAFAALDWLGWATQTHAESMYHKLAVDLDNGKREGNRIGLYAFHLTWKKSKVPAKDAYGELCTPYIPSGMNGTSWSLFAMGDCATALRVFRAAGYNAFWDGRDSCHSIFHVSLEDYETARTTFENETYSDYHKESIRHQLKVRVDYRSNDDRSLDAVPYFMLDLTREEMHEAWLLTDERVVDDMDVRLCAAFVEKYKAAREASKPKRGEVATSLIREMATVLFKNNHIGRYFKSQGEYISIKGDTTFETVKYNLINGVKPVGTEVMLQIHGDSSLDFPSRANADEYDVNLAMESIALAEQLYSSHVSNDPHRVGFAEWIEQRTKSIKQKKVQLRDLYRQISGIYLDDQQRLALKAELLAMLPSARVA